MALKFKFKTKEEIPAEHLPLYSERDGAWLLDVDGAVEKTKLDEFRTTNVSLRKERDELRNPCRPRQIRDSGASVTLSWPAARGRLWIHRLRRFGDDFQNVIDSAGASPPNAADIQLDP